MSQFFPFRGATPISAVLGYYASYIGLQALGGDLYLSEWGTYRRLWLLFRTSVVLWLALGLLGGFGVGWIWGQIHRMQEHSRSGREQRLTRRALKSRGVCKQSSGGLTQTQDIGGVKNLPAPQFSDVWTVQTDPGNQDRAYSGERPPDFLVLSYLVMMAARLVELHRVLKPPGSL